MGVLGAWLMGKEDQALFIKEKQLEASQMEEYYRPRIECLNVAQRVTTSADRHLSNQSSSLFRFDSGSGT